MSKFNNINFDLSKLNTGAKFQYNDVKKYKTKADIKYIDLDTIIDYVSPLETVHEVFSIIKDMFMSLIPDSGAKEGGKTESPVIEIIKEEKGENTSPKISKDIEAEQVSETPSNEETPAPNPGTTPSGNVPKEDPSKGFVVTTDNRKVELSEDDFNLLCTIVAKEADASSYDDKLAVASVILNRTDDPTWTSWITSLGYDGESVRGQIICPGQFSTYTEGMTYNNSTYDEKTKQAVMDALSGIRNHEYLSFRAEWTDYSDNQISEKGNRYK